MSRGMAGWLCCATAVFLLHMLGWDSCYTKQLVFGLLVAYELQPAEAKAWILNLSLSCLQYALIAFAVWRLSRWFLSPTNSSKRPGPAKVLLFPCKTTHARLFPKKHSFEYSYLVVGIPVGWEGTSGGMVSSFSTKPSWFSLPAKGWYHIDPADYLERGNGHLGLRGKLDIYLKSQGADPAQYPHVYLVTAARFLGHHFNPVSFWYLYTADMTLCAMILEVNNTFDERRMYYLTAEEADASGLLEEPEHLTAANRENSSKKPVFKKEWKKDFHVSPFNSRKGAYSLLASDPFNSPSGKQDHIDGTITLKSSKGHGKIVARLVSNGQAIDPSRMTMLQKARFLLSWWWVGFVTFPRIVREAGRLWFQRRLHVWFRPEPLKESLGRQADAAERKLEIAFRKYLRSLVEQCQASVAVKYIPSGISESGHELMLSPSAKSGSTTVEEMDFKVLTPVFYTRFVCYAHDLEALFSELRENCTIWLSRPDLLPKLLFKKPVPALEARSPLDYLGFEAIRYLRRRPGRIVQPLTSSQRPPDSTKTSAVDIRDFRISSMDTFILKQEDAALKKMYRNILWRLFVADRFALGSLTLVDGVLILLQTCVSWTLVCAWQGRLNVLGIGIAMLLYGYD